MNFIDIFYQNLMSLGGGLTLVSLIFFIIFLLAMSRSKVNLGVGAMLAVVLIGAFIELGVNEFETVRLAMYAIIGGMLGVGIILLASRKF